MSVRWLLAVILICVAGSENVWARCAECPIPFRVISGNWMTPALGDDLVLVIDPPKRASNRQVSTHLVDTETCEVVREGSLRRTTGSSVLVLELADDDGRRSRSLLFFRDEETAIFLDTSCSSQPNSQNCYLRSTSRKVMKRVTGFRPYCEAFLK